MANYLSLWELDQSRLPEDARERAEGWKMLQAMVQADLDSGRLKDWGSFVGGHSGFVLCEGTSVELELMQQQYVPWVKFTTYEFDRLDINRKVIEAMLG
jgi:hypothetical protein